MKVVKERLSSFITLKAHPIAYFLMFILLVLISIIAQSDLTKLTPAVVFMVFTIMLILGIAIGNISPTEDGSDGIITLEINPMTLFPIIVLLIIIGVLSRGDLTKITAPIMFTLCMMMVIPGILIGLLMVPNK